MNIADVFDNLKVLNNEQSILHIHSQALTQKAFSACVVRSTDQVERGIRGSCSMAPGLEELKVYLEDLHAHRKHPESF